MGVTGVTLPRDPIQEQPTYDGALARRAAQADPRAVRERWRQCAGRRRPSPRSSSPSPHSPIPGTTARSWYLGGAARSPTLCPPRAVRGVHLGRPHPAADRPRGRHRRRLRRAVDRDAGLQRAQTRTAPPSSRHRSADRRHHGHRRGRGERVAALLEAQRRPAGHDQRGPPRRQGDLRAERLAARQRAQARRGKSTPLEPVLSLRRPTWRRCRRAPSSRSPSRSTTRATCTVPVPASGVDQRAQRRPADLVLRRDRARRAARRSPSPTPRRCRRTCCCPSSPA